MPIFRIGDHAAYVGQATIGGEAAPEVTGVVLVDRVLWVVQPAAWRPALRRFDPALFEVVAAADAPPLGLLRRVPLLLAAEPSRRILVPTALLFPPAVQADAPPLIALRRSLVLVEESRHRLIVPVALLFPEVQAAEFPPELLARRVPGWMRDPVRQAVSGWQTVIVAEGAAAAEPFPDELLGVRRVPRVAVIVDRRPFPSSLAALLFIPPAPDPFPVELQRARRLDSRIAPTPAPVRVVILPIEGAPDEFPAELFRMAPRRVLVVPQRLVRLVLWVPAQLAPPPIADPPPLSPAVRRRVDPAIERVLRIVPWVAAQLAPPPVADAPPLSPAARRRAELVPERVLRIVPWVAAQQAPPPVVDAPPLAPARPRRVEPAPERMRITTPWAAVLAATPSFVMPVELLGARRLPIMAAPAWVPRGRRFEQALFEPIPTTVLGPGPYGATVGGSPGATVSGGHGVTLTSCALNAELP